MFSNAKSVAGEIYNRFINDDGLPLAGNIAFCTLLAVFPFLIFLTALAGFFSSRNLAEAVVTYLLAAGPSQITAPLANEAHDILTVPRGNLLTLSVLVTLYTAAGGVESIRTGLNRAYDMTETRLWPFRMVQNIVFVVAGAFVLIALAALLVFGPVYWSRMAGVLPVLEPFSGWFYLLRNPAGLMLMFIALLSAHMFLPRKRHPVRELLPGIAATMVLWLIAAFAYSDYLSRFSTVRLMYAGLSNVIIALLFLYISAAVLILGGEINQVLIARRTRVP